MLCKLQLNEAEVGRETTDVMKKLSGNTNASLQEIVTVITQELSKKSLTRETRVLEFQQLANGRKYISKEKQVSTYMISGFCTEILKRNLEALQ